MSAVIHHVSILISIIHMFATIASQRKKNVTAEGGIFFLTLIGH